MKYRILVQDVDGQRGHRDYCYTVADGGQCDCDFPWRPVRWVDAPAALAAWREVNP